MRNSSIYNLYQRCGKFFMNEREIMLLKWNKDFVAVNVPVKTMCSIKWPFKIIESWVSLLAKKEVYV